MVKGLVSIIIPTYNRKGIVEDAIECAIRQTYKETEIIIVDNHSTDGTYEYLKKRYEDNQNVRIYTNDVNLGPVKNWKKCLEYSNGEFCKILWSDDLMEDEFVEKAVKVLQNNRDVAFVYSKVSRTRIGAKRKYGITFYSLGRTGKYKREVFLEEMCNLRGAAPVSPGCALFRTKDVKIVERIPNNLGIDYLSTGAGPDVLIFLLATVNYPYIYYIDEVLNFFRSHNGSISDSGIELYYSYLTAKLYFVNFVLPNRKYRKLLLEDAIKYCIYKNEKIRETYLIVKRCDQTVTNSEFILLYQKKIYQYLKERFKI